MMLQKPTTCMKLIAMTAIVLASPYTQAEDAEFEWQAGIGVVVADTPWVDVDNVVAPFPFVSAQYGNWRFFDEGLISYQWLDEDELSFYTGLDYRDDGYDADGFINNETSDNPVFDGYESPDGDMVFTVGGHWQFVGLSLQQDISGNSKGLTADLMFEHPIYSVGEKFILSASAGMHWQSSDYTQHVYGIEGDQIDVSKGRIAYQPGSATNYSVGLTGIYALNSDWTLIGGYHFVRLDDNIENSPLIEDDKMQSAYLGAVYQF